MTREPKQELPSRPIPARILRLESSKRSEDDFGNELRSRAYGSNRKAVKSYSRRRIGDLAPSDFRQLK